MKKKVAIYLAGSIQKGHENPHESYWGEEEIKQLQQALSGYEVILLNPALRTDDLSDSHSVFGRDMLQVFCSQVVFVDARNRRGLGVGAEMMWAKMNQIPVVIWAPKNSHYHKEKATVLGVEVSDFVHPFVYGLADQIVETVAEGGRWIEKYLFTPSSVAIKSREDIHRAIEHYKATQLAQDTPMQELLRKIGAPAMSKA